MRALTPRRWSFVAVLSLCAALGTLGACSDSEFAEPFLADRVVAFGDESSVILADGRKYTINDFTEGNIDCAKNPIWVQELAGNFARPFATCAAAGTNAASISRAEAGATVDGLRQQVDAQLATGRLGEKDLVTMFVGMNDVMAEYARLATEGEPTIAARLADAGRRLGAQVNRVATAGSPVLIVTLPDLGRTPFAAAEEAASAGRAALLTRLTREFNTAMRLEIINDGRMIGLVDAFDLFANMARVPAAYLLSNTTQQACLDTAPTPDCSTQTLVQNGGTSVDWAVFLWADKLHFGPTGHRQLGIIATGRARNNPF